MHVMAVLVVLLYEASIARHGSRRQEEGELVGEGEKERDSGENRYISPSAKMKTACTVHLHMILNT